MLSELRVAFRRIARAPGFSAVLIVTLGLGIGAATAVFSSARALFLHRLPFPGGQQLVSILHTVVATGETAHASWADLEALDTGVPALAGVVAYRATANGWAPSTIAGMPGIRLTSVEATRGFFALLGVHPTLGRLFVAEDYRAPGATTALLLPPIVISHAFWQKRFGGRADVVGTTLTIDDARTVVVGVLPPGFRFLGGGQPEVFFAAAPPDRHQWQWHWRTWDVVARLRAPAGMAVAHAQLAALARRRAGDDPEHNRGIGIRVRRLHDQLFGAHAQPFPILFATAGALLAIACATSANLLLSRSAQRERDLSLRSALGASRGRLLRQLMFEHALLALAAGILGVVFAVGALHAFSLAAISAGMNLPPLQMDAGAAGFALAVTVFASLAFGLAPSLHLLQSAATTALVLKGGAGLFSAHRSALRLSRLFLAAQVALALALLSGVALLLETLWHLKQVPLGFAPERVSVFEIGKIPFENSGPPGPRHTVFWPQLLEQVEALPEVQSAAFCDDFPLARPGGEAGAFQLASFTIEGVELPAPGFVSVEQQEITGGYFQALGIPLVAGRSFGRELRTTAMFSGLNEAVVGERFARAHWPDRSPLGQRIVGPHRIAYTVVGVVRDVQQHGLRQGPPARQVYTPVRYWDFCRYESQFLVVRSSLPPAALRVRVESVLHQLDPERTVLRARAMDEVIDGTTAWDRFRAALVAMFGGIALLLTVSGLYATVARTVSCRTREIGVRIALGAPPGAIRSLVMRQGLRPALFGVAIGAIAAGAGARLLASQFFGVSPTTPALLAGVSALLIVVSYAACWLPARRATRIDPIAALRAE